jgi:hypothetical protein
MGDEVEQRQGQLLSGTGVRGARIRAVPVRHGRYLYSGFRQDPDLFRDLLQSIRPDHAGPECYGPAGVQELLGRLGIRFAGDDLGGRNRWVDVVNDNFITRDLARSGYKVLILSNNVARSSSQMDAIEEVGRLGKTLAVQLWNRIQG